MAGLTWLWPLFLLSICSSEASRILVVFAYPSKSHSILGNAFVGTLLEAGHEVTYITSYPRKNLPPKLQQIDVTETVNSFPFANMVNMEKIMKVGLVSTSRISSVFSAVQKVSVTAMENEDVQKLINDPSQKFDLVVYEWMFSELYSGLAAVYDCPFIMFSSAEPHWMLIDRIDEALHPAYNPDTINSIIPPYNFKQRVLQLLVQIVGEAYWRYSAIPYQTKEYERLFGSAVAKRGRSLPAYDELRYNASLMLGNSHVSLGEATRLPQSYKPIGGFHVDPTVKPLPEDLKKLMDNAKDGIIYYSMGSNLKSKDMPVELKRDLLKMFGTLKYTVIWKFEEKLPEAPKNVHILQWAPQQSILAHPNCILFITHGGLLSITETVHFGVPVIGIPVFADQYINVDRIVNKGYGKKVNLSYKMAEELRVAIEEITSNHRYTQKAREISFIYHHRPSSPRAELVHWVEHVVRTRGARHLRSPALLVPWYQKMYLDLAGVILAIIIVLRYTFTRLFCRSKKVDVGKKNK